MNNIRKGILLAFLASVISGVAIFYSKISVAKIPPLVLTTSRNFYVGILFLILFIVSGKIAEIKELNKKKILNLILIGLIGGALPFYLFFTGLQYTQALSANVIQKTLFIWVTILAVIFLKERVTLSYFIGFFLVILANFYIGGGELTISKGELMIFAATILWSIENILAKKALSGVSSEVVGLFRMGIGGSLLLITTLITGKAGFFQTINSQHVTTIIIGGTILFFYVFTWYKALKYAPASLVTLILTFSVVVGNILNGSFAGVKIAPKDIYSSVLIVGASIIILLQSNVIPHLMRNLFNRFPLPRE